MNNAYRNADNNLQNQINTLASKQIKSIINKSFHKYTGGVGKRITLNFESSFNLNKSIYFVSDTGNARIESISSTNVTMYTTGYIYFTIIEFI